MEIDHEMISAVIHPLPAIVSYCTVHKVPGSVRNKQLPTCPNQVKFAGSKLKVLEGCPLDNLKFWKIKILELILLHSLLIAGVRNYQILLLVQGIVKGRNPLVQLKFTYPKIDIFFLIS